MRHNAIRDLEVELLREACRDVRVEPALLQANQNYHESANSSDNARVDVSAVGLWAPFERSYMDVRIFHPNAPTYLHKNLRQVYRQQEGEKKRQFNDEIINIDRGTFTPLFFSTSGGMWMNCDAYHKRLAQLISLKRDEKYSQVMMYQKDRDMLSPTLSLST